MVSTAAATAPSSPTQAPARFVRVPAERLDELMDRVGELVIVHSRLSQLANGQGGDMVLRSISEEIERLVSELRDTMMVLRMVPVATLFGRFRRLIHDLARAHGPATLLVTHDVEEAILLADRVLVLEAGGRKFDAAEALRLGLVKEVVADGDLLTRAIEYADELATRCSPWALAQIKGQLYDESDRAAVAATTARSVELMNLSIKQPDVIEGITSFFERRDPRFPPLASLPPQ